MNHIKIVIGKDDDAMAKKILEVVALPLHERYRLYAQNRVEKTLLEGANARGMHSNGEPITTMRQLHKCCFGQDLDNPQDYKLVWEVFFGMDGPHDHGATTFERDLLKSQGITYFDPKELGDLNSKFGKPTKTSGGCAMQVYSAMKSQVYRRTVTKKERVGDFHVVNSLSKAFDKYKHHRKGNRFCAALHITYRGQPIIVELVKGAPTDQMRRCYWSNKQSIDLVLSVHPDYNRASIPPENAKSCRSITTAGRILPRLGLR